MNAVKTADKLISRCKYNNTRHICNIHYHESHELYYMLSGGTTYFIGDEIYSIEKGNFVFIPKGILHKTDNENSPSNERILINFHEDILPPEALPLLQELEKSCVIYIPDNYLRGKNKIIDELKKRQETVQTPAQPGAGAANMPVMNMGIGDVINGA